MQISLEEVRKVAMLYQAVRAERPPEVVYEPETVPPVLTEFSDDPALVKEIVQEVLTMSDVREDRVQQIKTQLESGEYQVDAKATAEAILRRILADRLK